ncbi:S8 family peptidase [Actinomadura sp. NTSP31]|uniref:S8 family peptidase n=1 Tax=Actinomadura sp. NTSP31 TaxID=1735447 RepID=UPI0035C09AB4
MLDSRLKFLRSRATDRARLARLAATDKFGITVEGVERPHVHVLVQVADSGVADKVRKTPGFGAFKHSGRVMSGTVELDSLGDLDRLEGVTYVQAAQPMMPELNQSVPEINATAVHTGTPSRRGTGVVVGIIDTGIDWRHRTFRDANGNSRILSIWDQGLTPVKGESAPAGYSYGVEYKQSAINAALKAADPLAAVRHIDGNGHGTHVAGIAAGRGVAANDQDPKLLYPGVAPDADLIIVGPIMDTAKTLDAIRYVFDTATALGKPAVINLSMGSSAGAHDGTDLFEQGIDNVLGTAGRALIKSAGNSGANAIHASGTMAAAPTITVEFEVPPNDAAADSIELWYKRDDRISVSVTPPGGTASDTVAPGAEARYLTLSNGNGVNIASVLQHPLNGDNQICLELYPGDQNAIAAGTWRLRLTGNSAATSWHAWVTSGGTDNLGPKFTGTYANNACTITIPGTCKEVISIASYITYYGGTVGDLSSFSSRGPTRDDRAAPTLAAPGQWIWSAKVNNAEGSDGFVYQQGTSMAAPHMAGVCALMLQARPTLTQAQILTCLTASARSDGFTGAKTNSDWGAGKVDARAAVDQAAKL